MSDYIVSARKYRPDSFETLIGQDNIARTLKNSILRGQLAHAYLFCGPRGVGKTSTARIFAKTINCQHPGPNMEPCGECESCVSFAEGRSYCIYELDAASNNSVEDIKSLMEKVQIPPQTGNYSVYIIDEVHMLSTAAFNAFLKTLEEPPSYAVFILCTTEKHKVLPTILSRCQTYDFNRISVSDMVRNLRTIADKEGVKVDDESLHVIGQKADGAMRDALTIFDQTVAFCGNDIKYEDVIRNLGVLDYEYCFRMVESFLAKDYASALLELDDILSKGFNALHFVSALGDHLRNLLVARTGGLEALLDLPDSLKARYREQAGKCSVKFIYDALGIVTSCEAGYKSSTNQRLHIEYALMRLAFLGGVPESNAAPAPTPVAKTAPVTEAPAPAAKTAPVTAASAPSPAPASVAKPAPSSAAAPAPIAKPAPASEAIELLDIEPASSPVVVPPLQGIPVPADEPATDDVPAPAPAETPVARRASRAKKVMSGLLSGEDQAETPGTSRPENGPQAETQQLPSDEYVREKWPELIKACAVGKPRLEHALNNAPLTCSEEDGWKNVSFEVTNDAQKAWIENGMLRDMESSFSAILGSSRVRMSVTVKPVENIAPKVYMPAEKAKEMMNANPEVLNLVKDLGLDAN